MIRRARFADIPVLKDMMREMHSVSRYAGLTFDERHVQALFQAFIQRDGGQHDGGTMVRIAEKDGEPIGFMVGVLTRVYDVMVELDAKDAYLFVRPGEAPTVMMQLLSSYVAWAQAIPKINDIWLSWSDAVEGAERTELVYGRMGFRRSGGMFVRAAR